MDYTLFLVTKEKISCLRFVVFFAMIDFQQFE